MRNLIYWTVTLAILSFNIGCTHSIASDSEKMLKLAAALTKLSSAVESTVNSDNPPFGISDSDLLTLATKHDPRILEPFADYTVRVLSQDHHAILLVCTKDRKRGLLEDAGCSSKFDMHLWKEQPANECEFTLSPTVICNGN